MYAQSKPKGSRKSRDKTKGTKIEKGIPEIPRISDFEVTDCGEPVVQEDELNYVDSDLTELAQEVKDINIGNKEHEEEKEKSPKSDSHNEVTSQSCVVAEIVTENSRFEAVESKPRDSSIEVSVESTVVDNICIHEFNRSKTHKASDYYNLAAEVENYMKEINEPSAPAVKGNIKTESIVTNNFQHIQGEKVISVEKPVNISKYNFTLELQDTLPPFSEEKLSEFYYNSELHESKTCVDDFLNQEINNNVKGDNKFYKMLIEYLQLKNSLNLNAAKIQDLKEELNVCVSNIWTTCNVLIHGTEKEKCNDGNCVAFEHIYTQAQFHTNSFKEFSSLIAEIKYLTFQTYITDAFACSVLKLKIEHYLQCLLTPCPEFTNLEEDSLASLSPISADSHFQQCLSDLKMAISVLFIFQRKQSLEVGRSFIKESREWLADLVSVLLRVGSWKDHIFLLSHVMRCPGGISEWATQFIQLPYSIKGVDPFNQPDLNHMMAVLNILLSPIEQRENFIKKWESELESDINPWTVIDSDGELDEEEYGDNPQSCPLKENDLVSLLNQIPFSHLFKSLLRYDGKVNSLEFVSSNYLLKFFSFMTDFIKILLSGLKLYSTDRYKQFTKRLGRLIYHIVQYATDALIVFKSQNMPESEVTRIQVEYDNFFLKATKFIYSSKKHGTWQFLATIPFRMASANAILKLYGILQLNDHQNDSVIKVNFSNFEEKFAKLPEEEQIYLLTTFTNMALPRNISEIQFVKNILLQLFYIGFLSVTTRDHCYKNVKSLICSITSTYPFLMSEILWIQKNMFLTDPDHEQNLTVYLWMSLPIDIWQPEERDLETLSTWLSEPIQSVRNELARIILQSLNYGISEGELFLPVENHYKIAMMILQSNVKLVPENDSNMIKNVSNLVRSQSVEQSMNDWTWNLLLKLRLHLLDKPEATVFKYFSNLGEYLRTIPELEHNVELHRLVVKKHPVACYIALMTSTLGHSVPIIFDKGFKLIDVLLNAYKYEAGIACIEYMSLLFLECCESLYKCESFIALLSRLVATDSSYVQFAKNLISNNVPGPVLKCLENMIQNQINFCRTVYFTKLSSVIEMWLLSLTRIPLWSQDSGVLYLVDMLLQNSFYDTICTKTVIATLENLLEGCTSPSETKSSLSSLVSWMNSKYSPPTLLPKGYNGEIPWFAHSVIQLEYEIYEKKCSVWPELLRELLSNSDKKTNVDNSLKKVCNNLRIPVRQSSVLAIYKWSNQILETDISHPLVPLIWQRFFSLYLCKVPGPIDRGGVGLKFFDGVINQTLFQRLKQRLQDTCEHYRILCETSEKNTNQEHFLKCHKLFHAYSLWLEETRLQDPFLSIEMLPSQYQPNLLGLLIYGNETPWIEYLEYHSIEQSFRNSSLNWTKVRKRGRIDKGSRILNIKEEKSPADRINDRLNSYSEPLPPPRINLKKYAFQKVSIDILRHSDKMVYFVKPFLKVLLDYVEQYTADVNENVSLGCDMQELLPHVYYHVETRKVLKCHCAGISRTVNGKNVQNACSGPAVIELKYQESKLDDQCNQRFSQCKKSFDLNIQKGISSIPSTVSSSAVLIDIAIEELKKEYNLAMGRGDIGRLANDLRGTGIHLFYEFVRTDCEKIRHTPPLNKAFDSYIDLLGRTFIEDNTDENDRILHMILDDDSFGEKLCKYFTPNASSSHDFIENYSKAVACQTERKFLILSKFDLTRWLSEKKTKYSERSRLISTIGEALKSFTGETEKEQLILNLLNEHLEILLMYDFPEHYGEILNFLLKETESQSISVSTWFIFLNAIALGNSSGTGRPDRIIFEQGLPLKKLKHHFNLFATYQNWLPFEVIQGTMVLLGSTFKGERLRIGSHELYKKYHHYIEPLFMFFGMLSHACVAKALQIDTGSLSDKLAQQLWPLVNDLYSPWLIPYWNENDKAQNTQITQEYSVLLPWLASESSVAYHCISIFTESVRFLYDALPGLNQVLSYVWRFYVTNFAFISVKEYVWNVIHDSFINLPWESFYPNIQDVELMLKIVDQFLPLCHSFLGSIFVNIKWTELVHYYLGLYDSETTAKLHVCLLHLLVKLPLEPSLKQNDKVAVLLTEANDYAWHLVDSSNYEIVLNWFIMSCDPRIILMDERLEYYKLDSAILRLLQSCASYVPTAKSFHPTTLTKRLMFVRACVKWLKTSNRRFRSKDSPLFKPALYRIWNDMDIVLTETVPLHQRIDEAGILLSEFLTIVAEPDLSPVVEATLSSWLSTQRSQVIIFGLFRSAGVSIENPGTFGNVIESSLESYFTTQENCDWSEVTQLLVPFSKSNARLEKALVDNNCFLTLYTILTKRVQKSEHTFSSNLLLTDLLQLLSEVKLSTPLEPKLTLLMVFCLKLAENELQHNVKEGISYLTRFSNMLNNLRNEKDNGFLSAIGLKKSSTTNRFKLICLIVSCGIIIFVQKNHSEYLNSFDDKVLQSLDLVDTNKIYSNIQQYATYAKTTIRGISTIEEIVIFLKHIGLKLFNKLYLK